MKPESRNPRIGIVVPTLGTRSHYLEDCLRSLAECGDIFICLVGPTTIDLDSIHGRYDIFVQDDGQGLAAAINVGVASLPDSVVFVNWIGDDDMIDPEGHKYLLPALSSKSTFVLAYGHCRYVDANGCELFVVRSGRWSEYLLSFGPQLISQPSMLFRRESFNKVGGLNESLEFAFDLDLLLRLRRVGRFCSVSRVTASYRWHHNALSVNRRSESVYEASVTRTKYLPRYLQRVSPLWERTTRGVSLKAGLRLQKKSKAFKQKRS